MPEPVIKVEGLYKKFARNLRSSMYYSAQDIARSMVGLQVPNERLRKNEFWALQDVSFELKKGEVLGVIGVNGSGKSTLLRILSGIYPPDKGTIEVKGRIGALIAVGAGIHPHMTGRENIYLNGIILGMTRKEVEKRFDEIVEFAELGPFLDSPVATYSSGMRVRLGFSIAVHVNPDIMLIDEVLAVGDMAFRLKSYDKIKELMGQGVSVIFVSHNDTAVKSICHRVILLNKGGIYDEGNPHKLVAKYIELNRRKHSKVKIPESPIVSKPAAALLGKINLVSFDVTDKNDNSLLIKNHDGTLNYNYARDIKEVYFKVTIDVLNQIKAPRIELSLMSNVRGEAVDVAGNRFVSTSNYYWSKPGQKSLVFTITTETLQPGQYYMNLLIIDKSNQKKKYLYIDTSDDLSFELPPKRKQLSEPSFFTPLAKLPCQLTISDEKNSYNIYQSVE